MAPPHTQLPSQKRMETSIQRAEIVVLTNLGWGYKKISKKTGVPVPTVQGIVKRHRISGRIDDAPRSGRPTLLSPANLAAIEYAVENNPHASLDDLTDQLHALKVKVGRTTINIGTKQLGFRLLIPRKKPSLDDFQKIRRKFWCYRQTGQRIRVRTGEELQRTNLAPTFRSGCIGIGCWAAITYESRTPLIHVRKRTPAKQTSKCDRLGLNAQQYASEINEPFLIPYLLSLNPPVHGLQLFLPANSPDLNPIENAWHLLKSRLRKRFSHSSAEHQPHTKEELWTAMEEEWEAIEQITLDKLLDSMPNCVEAVISANGGHTKW
ncbi:hypothetical protein L873DRAFT_1845066 [Choiromyces venosus 120613-1]|uniref:Tc1-like transposase DDE domain-containing protein n=1 Tax=Choiromyces venosus 120613-1 TaxID=1336337 RepID=A0A3N4JIX0_9PEZI|nr:hypothetical protein L873DRAFT_1845066 [Choiromyces venosus 120613-1]